MKDIVSTEWLKEHLKDENLILLDASLAKPVQGKASAYQNLTILSARYFDLKGKFSDENSKFPNTLPSAEQFEIECQKLGINHNSKIIIFDNLGIYSSPRVWWMFKGMGHQDVAVLNGGLPEWIANDGPTEEKEAVEYKLGDFKANFQKELLKTYQDLLNNTKTAAFSVVDARSKGRFEGTEEEPRKHLQSGSIPNSVNIPFQEVLEEGKFKPKEELTAIFTQRIASDKNLVFSCGSGLTACIVMLASEIAYKKSRYLYDGSWTEWAELQALTQ